MTTTAQTVWDRATQLSFLNDESLINQTQVLDYISLYERNVFLRAARLNPEYFGTVAVTATRANYFDPWDLNVQPGNVAAVTRAEVAAFVGTPYAGAQLADRVNLVSVRWPDLDVAPRALLRGRKIFPYPPTGVSGEYTSVTPELGPNNSNMVTALNVYYSPLPAKVVAVSQNLTLPDEWVDIITYQLAKILALRDRRTDEEMNWLMTSLQDLQQMFDEAVLVYDFGQRRPLGQVSPLPLAGLLPGSPAPQRGGQQPPPGQR